MLSRLSVSKTGNHTLSFLTFQWGLFFQCYKLLSIAGNSALFAWEEVCASYTSMVIFSFAHHFEPVFFFSFSRKFA